MQNRHTISYQPSFLPTEYAKKRSTGVELYNYLYQWTYFLLLLVLPTTATTIDSYYADEAIE